MGRVSRFSIPTVRIHVTIGNCVDRATRRGKVRILFSNRVGSIDCNPATHAVRRSFHSWSRGYEFDKCHGRISAQTYTGHGGKRCGRRSISDYHVYCVACAMNSEVMYLTGATATGRNSNILSLCVSRPGIHMGYLWFVRDKCMQMRDCISGSILFLGISAGQLHVAHLLLPSATMTDWDWARFNVPPNK